MGYIDCDAHVYENDLTWSYFDPDEEEHAPHQVNGVWVTEAMPAQKLGHARPDEYDRAFPPGTPDLTDVAARLARMDALGVDVQVLFSSWWLNAYVVSPVAESALARSWNRWMAEATSDSGGRLLWTCQAPVRMTDRAREELRFSREHGAVGVLLTGMRHGFGIGDPYYWPLFEEAQELDMVITVHVGGDRKLWAAAPYRNFTNVVLPVLGAFAETLSTGLPQRFPRLKFAFLEAGSAWVPYALQESLRSDGTLSKRTFIDWRAAADGILAANRMYVSAQMDDDIPYLLQFTGPDNMVLGTDYAHLDVGSDPDALGMVAARPDADAEVLRNVVDRNGRELYGIDPAFVPTDQVATLTG